MFIKLRYIQIKARPINVLRGPIGLEERKKSSCLNICDKPNEQKTSLLGLCHGEQIST